MKILNSIGSTKLQFDNALNEILDKQEYKNLKNPLYDLINKVRHYISKWILKIFMKFFSNLSNASSAADKLSEFIIILGLLFIAILIVTIYVKINKKMVRSKKIIKILGEEFDDKTTPYILRNKAASFEKEGELRQAIRYDFIAILLLMHNKKLIYLDEKKSNEENYMLLYKNNFLLLSSFRNLIDIFNSSWYGHKICNKEIYEMWKINMNDLWNGVTGGETKNKKRICKYPIHNSTSFMDSYKYFKQN